MWPAIVGNVLIGAGFIGQQYLQGRRGRWAKVAGSLAPTAGFIGAGLAEQAGYEDWSEGYEDYPERIYVQGFNPHTWGRESEVRPYGMGRW